MQWSSSHLTQVAVKEFYYIVDASNAFNSISRYRATSLHNIQYICPELATYTINIVYQLSCISIKQISINICQMDLLFIPRREPLRETLQHLASTP